MQKLDTNKTYRNILILESREWWGGVGQGFDPYRDLVLTYDLALQRMISGKGGQALYIDCLVDSHTMQRNNFRAYRFFKSWHCDATGSDIFVHRGIPFGFSFRIEIWNDLLSYISNRANLERLRELRFEQLLVGTESGLVESIISEMGVSWTPVLRIRTSRPTYYFPIHQWMDERVRPRKFRNKVMSWLVACRGMIFSSLDRVLNLGNSQVHVYFQFYHPTRKIFQALKIDPNIKVVQGYFTARSNKSKYLTECLIPIWGATSRFFGEAQKLMREFSDRRHAELVLENGCDISESVYAIIQRRVEERIAEYLRDLDCVIDYVERHPIQLEVMIANIGKIDTLVDCVCKQRGVPSYLIINGLMGPEYLDESKYASLINAYSESIKANYFRGMDNVICLGDPRMDDYVTRTTLRAVNREQPTVTIGASGFNPVDLNSYVSIEFEFMWDVLQALQNLRLKGLELRVIIKVRPNGYRHQYEAFVKEFFPSLVDEIHDCIPIREVLERTDLYISIYSQTLFEASCLGIPSIYYKKDKEILGPPFDGKSELVTVNSVPELERALLDFRDGSERFNEFMKKSVMEKYIGPLDGGNLKRNIQQVYSLLKHP